MKKIIKKKRGGGIKGKKGDKEFKVFNKVMDREEKNTKELRRRELMEKMKKKINEKKFGIAVKKGGMAKLPKGLQAYIKKKKKR